jgi:hypothetical protein
MLVYYLLVILIYAALSYIVKKTPSIFIENATKCYVKNH